MLEASRHVFAVRDGNIHFVCPNCKMSKTVNVERFLKRHKKVQVDIRCRCCHVQPAILERRRSYRKPTDIHGRYFFAPQNRPTVDGGISIKDLSYAGLGFNLLSACNVAFGVGDLLRVQFKLFQHSSLLIKKGAVIKQINHLQVNAAFQEPLRNEDDLLLKLFFYT